MTHSIDSALPSWTCPDPGAPLPERADAGGRHPRVSSGADQPGTLTILTTVPDPAAGPEAFRRSHQEGS